MAGLDQWKSYNFQVQVNNGLIYPLAQNSVDLTPSRSGFHFTGYQHLDYRVVTINQSSLPPGKLSFTFLQGGVSVGNFMIDGTRNNHVR
jgi:hypothetical protein